MLTEEREDGRSGRDGADKSEPFTGSVDERDVVIGGVTDGRAAEAKEPVSPVTPFVRYLTKKIYLFYFILFYFFENFQTGDSVGEWEKGVGLLWLLNLLLFLQKGFFY